MLYLIETKGYDPVKTNTLEGVFWTLDVWGYYTNKKEVEKALEEEGVWEDEFQGVTVEKVRPEEVEDVDYSFA